MAITKKALEYLGFKNKTDFVLQDDGAGVYIRDWLSDSTKPTDSAINTADTQAQAAYDAQEYARKRKAKYDALNQFELISDDAINGTTTHKDAIVAIKSEFPKP